MEIVKFDNELTAIEPSKAKQIKETFEPMVAMLEQFEERCNEVFAQASKEINADVSAKAKRTRLDIAKVRIDADKARKNMKDEYLRAGNAIQGAYNVLAWAVKDREDKLREIEEHAERMETERLKRLQYERVELLAPYVEDAETRELAQMDDEVWDAYLSAKKKAYNDRLEAERKAEQERIARERAEAEERERIRKENERLKAEAEAKEKELAKERAKVEAERKKAEEQARIEREKLEAESRAKLEAERAKRDKVEAELKARRDAELKEQARIELERKQAEKLAKAPIKNQLTKWVDSFELPETTIKHQKADEINAKFNAFKLWAINQIKEI